MKSLLGIYTLLIYLCINSIIAKKNILLNKPEIHKENTHPPQAAGPNNHGNKTIHDDAKSHHDEGNKY